jgi:hypothetical protein
MGLKDANECWNGTAGPDHFPAWRLRMPECGRPLETWSSEMSNRNVIRPLGRLFPLDVSGGRLCVS